VDRRRAVPLFRARRGPRPRARRAAREEARRLGSGDTHETLNAFTWGPDGWLYGCHGVFTHSKVGRPGRERLERTPINAGVWRFDPRTEKFEVFAWGTSNPWGVDFNERGECLITACVIPHLWHMIQGGRYERQAGSQFDAYAYSEIATIADHRHYLGTDPHGGNLRSNWSAAGTRTAPRS
jgi:putative membrane-bound dehydrogenase-like protein